MKITKILVALSFLFAAVTANAGTLTVTGNMEFNYISKGEVTTGNPLSTQRELKFEGSTELDNGITVSYFQDTTDAFGVGDAQLAFGNIMGLATIYIGTDSDPTDSIDDITPSAYEEANGSGSGSYTAGWDIGGNAGEMGIGVKLSLPILGALNAKYYPKVDGDKNEDGTTSGDTNAAVGSAYGVTLTTDMGNIPGVGGLLQGLVLTTGVEETEVATAEKTADDLGLTAALNYTYGPIKVGYQKKFHDLGQTTTAVTGQTIYRDDVIGIAYAINDSVSISYNRYTSKKSDDAANEVEQETDAINLGYVVGGMTIGFQDASTDNSGWILNKKADSRTVGISVAF